MHFGELRSRGEPGDVADDAKHARIAVAAGPEIEAAFLNSAFHGKRPLGAARR